VVGSRSGGSKLVAQDIVEHFEKRLEAMDGKAMVVCMSRRICVELYARSQAAPEWHHDDDEPGRDQGGDDRLGLRPARLAAAHPQQAAPRGAGQPLPRPEDPFKLVIVRDMWLTGFDAPSLHTMYVDKPMRGHGLMQAIARVNRVFKDKPGGLVVDYLGLAHELKQALATYTESGGTGRDGARPGRGRRRDAGEVRGLLRPVPRLRLVEVDDGNAAGAAGLLPAAQEHILAQENGKDRFLRAVRELSQAFALAVPHEEALRIRDDVAFFQAVQAVLAKRAPGDARPEEELDHAVRQIISRAVAPEGVVDIFAAAGSRSRTSRSSPTSSWPRCAACRSATSPWSCCRSC
jgi:type I restriction enzyme, R subunit